MHTPLEALELSEPVLAAFEHQATPMWVFDFERFTHPWANAAGRAFFLSPNLAEFQSRGLGEPSVQVRAETELLKRQMERGERLQHVHTFTPRGVRKQARVSVRPARLDGRLVALVEAWPATPGTAGEQVEPPNHWAWSSRLLLLVEEDGRVAEINPAAQELLGPVQDISELTDDPEDLDFLLRPMEPGQGSRRLVHCARLDSWLDLDLSWVFDPTSGSRRLLVEGRDVGLDVARREAMEASLSFLRQVVDSLPLPTVVLDSSLRILLANQTTSEYSEVPNSAVVGMEVCDFMDPSEQPGVRDFGLDALATPGTRSVEGWWTFPSGRRFMAVSATRITIAGSPHVVLVGTDLTQIREHSQQLEEARARAEAASLAKSEFLASVTHELRTPLNGVLGVAEIVAGSDDIEEVRELITHIRQAGRSLLNLINDLLLYATMGSNRLEIVQQSVRMEDFLRQLLLLHQRSADASNLELVLDLDPHVPEFVLTDALRLRQVLQNLLSNAIKFSQDGQIVLRAHCGGAAMLHVVVEDCGIGIEPDHIPRLFEAFTQADASISKRFGGTGLGLAVCRRLVEAMGGSIRAESELGEGSRFIVEIPAQPGEPSIPQPSGPYGVYEVLVVEDHPVNRMVARRLLESRGHLVEVVESGELALEAVRRTRPDLVLLDLHMPGMDGLETARALLRQAPGLPIMAMTADLRPQSQVACYEAGMRGYVTKPLSAQELQRALEALQDEVL